MFPIEGSPMSFFLRPQASSYLHPPNAGCTIESLHKSQASSLNNILQKFDSIVPFTRPTLLCRPILRNGLVQKWLEDHPEMHIRNDDLDLDFYLGPSPSATLISKHKNPKTKSTRR
jgi:hypothetical protein